MYKESRGNSDLYVTLVIFEAHLFTNDFPALFVPLPTQAPNPSSFR